MKPLRVSYRFFFYSFFIAFVFHVQEGLYIVRNHIDAFFFLFPFRKDIDTFHEPFFGRLSLYFGNVWQMNCYPFSDEWETKLCQTVLLYERVCLVCHILYTTFICLKLIQKSCLPFSQKCSILDVSVPS